MMKWEQEKQPYGSGRCLQLRYRDLWSKSFFSFLMFIFSLTEMGGKEGAPIIMGPRGNDQR